VVISWRSAANKLTNVGNIAENLIKNIPEFCNIFKAFILTSKLDSGTVILFPDQVQSLSAAFGTLCGKGKTGSHTELKLHYIDLPWTCWITKRRLQQAVQHFDMTLTIRNILSICVAA